MNRLEERLNEANNMKMGGIVKEKWIKVPFKNRIYFLLAHLAPYSRARVNFHKKRGVDLGKGVVIDHHAEIDFLFPQRVHIGDHATIGYYSVILAHDDALMSYGEPRAVKDTYIGKHAFVGAHCVVMPGVKIGEGSVIGAGSIVTKDVEPYSLYLGVPAKKSRDLPKEKFTHR